MSFTKSFSKILDKIFFKRILRITLQYIIEKIIILSIFLECRCPKYQSSLTVSKITSCIRIFYMRVWYTYFTLLLVLSLGSFILVFSIIKANRRTLKCKQHEQELNSIEKVWIRFWAQTDLGLMINNERLMRKGVVSIEVGSKTQPVVADGHFSL